MKESLSDMDYLRSKMVKKSDMVDESGEEDKEDDEEEKEEDGEDEEKEEINAEEINAEEEEEEERPAQQADSAYESGEKDTQKVPESKNKVSSVILEHGSNHYFLVAV